jgi:hypothetical protein
MHETRAARGEKNVEMLALPRRVIIAVFRRRCCHRCRCHRPTGTRPFGRFVSTPPTTIDRPRNKISAPQRTVSLPLTARLPMNDIERSERLTAIAQRPTNESSLWALLEHLHART